MSTCPGLSGMKTSFAPESVLVKKTRGDLGDEAVRSVRKENQAMPA
ncbi:MAG TPA: hypothetical protein VJK73_02515 [Candidatus Paceibacterota bacterium]